MFGVQLCLDVEWQLGWATPTCCNLPKWIEHFWFAQAVLHVCKLKKINDSYCLLPLCQTCRIHVRDRYLLNWVVFLHLFNRDNCFADGEKWWQRTPQRNYKVVHLQCRTLANMSQSNLTIRTKRNQSLHTSSGHQIEPILDVFRSKCWCQQKLGSPVFNGL